MHDIHLICNAHIDPVWQWEWEEGAAETISTFRVAADFCEQFDGFVFNHNEALLYRWVEEYEPALFARIQRLVAEGKWHIMGGWHLQPDCNMPSGESFIRQAQEGLSYFQEKFGVRPTTAINFDPFGHTRGLVQILKKCGYDSYLICRPGKSFITLPDDVFEWEGYDGSRVMVRRQCDDVAYNTHYGEAADKVRRVADRTVEDGKPINLCLWGVGNHGGGPSRVDLEQLAALKEELAKADINLIHSTPEAYFAAVKEQEGKYVHTGDLNPWAPGCYTSQIRVKQWHRRTESLLFTVEKMCTAAAVQGLMLYPKEELGDVLYDLLTVQFHDTLPGSSIQAAEEMAVRMFDHALEILSRVRARAFFALSGGQQKAASDEIPIMAYNPHPYPIEGDFTCEMMLWDQNWNPEFSMPQVYGTDGTVIPTQCEKEASNLALDWRKRVVFHATLPPMSMSRFNCKYTALPEKPKPVLAENDTHYIFTNDRVAAHISKKTGGLDAYIVDGVSLLKPGAFALNVIADDADPWGMLVTSFPKKIGRFALMSREDGADFSGVSSPIDSVRIIEDGAVRTVVEVVLRYKTSRAVVQYKFSKTDTAVDVSVRLQWMEIQKMVKMRLPMVGRGVKCIGEVAFGEEPFDPTGRECVTQRYQLLRSGNKAVGLINNGVYGGSFAKGALDVTLLRSAGYCAHPILPERPLIPQDRFTPHIDQGERLYEFRLIGGNAAEVSARLPREAESFAQSPMVLSFFPAGGGVAPSCPFTVEGAAVQVSAIKQAEDGNGIIVRLFNPSAKRAKAVLSSEPMHIRKEIRFGAYEVKTFRLTKGRAKACDMLENDINA